MNPRCIATLAFMSAMLAGCASYNYTDAPPTMGGLYSKYAVIGYSGDLRPIRDVGVVSTDGLIKVRSVDGQALSQYRRFTSGGFYSGGRFQLHLLPGSHTVVLAFHDDRGNGSISWSATDITKTITVEKGQVLHLFVSQEGRTWSAKEADGSGAIESITSDFAELSAKR